jgi:cytochrome c-type biogenesis protein CcmH/NrfG
VVKVGITYVNEHPEDVHTMHLVAVAAIKTAEKENGIDAKTLDSLVTILKKSGNKTNDAETFRLLGNIYFAKKEYIPATGFYNRAIALTQGTNIGALIGIGRVFIAQGYPERAQFYFERAEQLAPDNIDVLLAAGEYYLIQAKPKEAEKIAMEIVVSDADQYTKAYGHHILGSSYMMTGKFDDAKSEFNEALAINPYLTDSLIGKAQALLKLMLTAHYSSVTEYTEEPKQLAERVLSYDTNNPFALDILSRIYNLRKDKQNSLVYSEKAWIAASQRDISPAKRSQLFSPVATSSKPKINITSIKVAQ